MKSNKRFDRLYLSVGIHTVSIAEGLNPFRQTFRKDFKVLSFAFPDNYYMPTEFLQLGMIPFVSIDILLKLGIPECAIALWLVSKLASRVPMPIATINQNDRPPARKNNIWTSGQILSMKPKPVTHVMKE